MPVRTTRIAEAVLVVTLGGLVACASPRVPTIEAFVTRDGRVVAEPNRVPTGEVILRIQNDQSSEQRMVLVRTELQAHKLPVAEQIVPIGNESDTDFEGDGYTLVTKLDPMRAFYSGAAIVARMHEYLERGAYVLFSNMPGHYASGRFVAITVE